MWLSWNVNPAKVGDTLSHIVFMDSDGIGTLIN